MVAELFTPAAIGPVTLANRIVRSATIECLCPLPGQVDARYVRLYEELARGGAGLIVTGNFFVDRRGVAHGSILILDSDRAIPELARVAAAVKRHGAAIFGQLNHGGRYSSRALIGATPFAPSPVRERIHRVVPTPMTGADIDTAIGAFAAAARRLQEAGFDGVEINAAHGYLVNQFLSRRTNRRRDAWGGRLENRIRFLEQVVLRTREATGEAFPVTVKLNGRDDIRGGVRLEECVATAQRLEALGVSGVTVSGGVKERGLSTTKGAIPRALILRDRRGLDRVRASLYLLAMRRAAVFREGYFLDSAAAVKRHVRIPVTSVGGFRTAAAMRAAVAGGSTDLIGLARPFVREPDLPNRLRDGRTAAAACVNCNQCTVRTVLFNEPLRCHLSARPAPEGGSRQ